VIVIRCTQKMLKRVGPPASEPPVSTTRLGDWTVNLLGVGRQRFVLLVAERTRLPILLRRTVSSPWSADSADCSDANCAASA
jgi:hypothetical protein